MAVPLSLVVTNAKDRGAGSLRDAVTKATSVLGSPNTIVFSYGTAGGAVNFFDGAQHTINLLTALPAVPANLTIAGPGSAMLTVQRDPAATSTFRVFDITGTSAQSVALFGMTISGGNNGNVAGAAIQNANSTLTLTDVTVANNTSMSAGAGIYMSGPGVLNVVNSHIVSNNTTGGTSGGAFAASGGGIYSSSVSGSVNLINSTLANNQTYQGGGIDVAGTLTISNSTLTDNTATYGGAIELATTATALGRQAPPTTLTAAW